jgi:putative endonuclease
MIMQSPSTKETGNKGEQLAAQHLRQLGFGIVEMNYRYGHGEIDIIARDDEVLVFCEVKSRSSDKYGEPEYALTPKKQQQIRRIAQAYLYEHEIKEQACRFDVVAIRFNTNPPQINYIRNAF